MLAYISYLPRLWNPELSCAVLLTLTNELSRRALIGLVCQTELGVTKPPPTDWLTAEFCLYKQKIKIT
jgi:hypothetical protein